MNASLAPSSPWHPFDPELEFTTPVVMKFDQARLLHYAWASGDYNPIHFEATKARAMGLPGVIAHGMLILGLAHRAMEALRAQAEDFCGRPVALCDIETKFSDMTLVNCEVSVIAKVARQNTEQLSLSFYVIRDGDRSALSAQGSVTLKL